MPRRRIPPECNLYSSYTTQEATCRAFEVSRDSAGNVPPLPATFPNQMAPVVRLHDGERELTRVRWGFPPPSKGRHPASHQRPQSWREPMMLRLTLPYAPSMRSSPMSSSSLGV
jgi:putative SOS response-associated peptidase YedK